MDWLQFVLFMAGVFILIPVVKLFLRKVLHIEKEKVKFFSYNHINSLHKRTGWIVRITTMIVSIIVLFLIILEDYSENFYLFTWLVLIGIDFAVRAFFEWKYSKNPKQSILTISEGFLLMSAITVVIQFNFLSF